MALVAHIHVEPYAESADDPHDLPCRLTNLTLAECLGPPDRKPSVAGLERKRNRRRADRESRTDLLVRVAAQREPAEGASDLGGGAVARQPEPVVVVLLAREGLHTLARVAAPLLLPRAYHGLKLAHLSGTRDRRVWVGLAGKPAVAAGGPNHGGRLRGGELVPSGRQGGVVQHETGHGGCAAACQRAADSRALR